jgi:hypothetical protein
MSFIRRKNTYKKIYNCFYCSAKIFSDEAVRSEKTNKRVPFDLETGIRHECAAFYSVNNRVARAEGKQLFFGK